MKSEDTRAALVSVTASLMSIAAGLLFGFFILLVSNPGNAPAGIAMVLQGGFSSGQSGIAQTINFAVPIIMTGLSVGLCFKTGLFNIGASGQFTMGSFAAIYAGIHFNLPPGAHWAVCIILAAIAGGLWGFIPGILKATFNVNEVIASIMTNYIAVFFVNMLIPKLGLYDMLRNQTMPVSKTALNPRMGMDVLFPGTALDISIFFAILAVAVTYILLEKTAFGYEIKACGMNRDAARYAGINEKKSIVLTMVIAGVLSGLGGGLMYLGHSGKFMQVLDVISPEGFGGISVALLGASNPIGILFAGLFISHITIGGYNMQLLNYVPEIIDMIVAAIIYCGAFVLLFKGVAAKLLVKKSEEAN